MNYSGYVGKGRSYDSKRNWEGIEKILGYQPFEGTLNIAISPIMNENEVLEKFDCVNIFQDFTCIRGMIKGKLAHFCYSNLRSHEEISTLYVVCGNKLREEFRLKDGDRVGFTLSNK